MKKTAVTLIATLLLAACGDGPPGDVGGHPALEVNKPVTPAPTPTPAHDQTDRTPEAGDRTTPAPTATTRSSDDMASTPEADDSVTPNPIPTSGTRDGADPTPGVGNPRVLVFPLAPGSEITFVDPSSGEVARETLSGTLNLYLRRGPTLFNFEITQIELHSESFSVSATSGDLWADTRGRLLGSLMRTNALINGEEVPLYGGGGLDTFEWIDGAFRLTGVEVSGDGYSITIFTEPLTILQEAVLLFTFPLTEGSEIVFTDPVSGEVVREALCGTLRLLLRPCPHSSFAFEIRHLELHSKSISVSGTEGSLAHELGEEMALRMHANVQINGEDVQLVGVGGPDTFESVRPGTLRFTGVEASGGDYSIIIFTDPVTIYPDLEG